MTYCPFEYTLTEKELHKFSEMVLTWSHTEHTIGNCLKAVLNFNDDEAIALVFPLALENRVRWLRGLRDRLNPDGQTALDELALMLPGLQAIRTSGVHGIIINDTKDGPLFHVRSKDRTFTKADFFACEDFTNYVAQIAVALRYAIGFPRGVAAPPHTLPERPVIPKALEAYIQIGKKSGQPPEGQPRSSPV
jgi:hypothetical protein